MKIKLVLLAFTFIFIATSKALAQDPLFTQWENTPLYLNPALTGNFDGLSAHKSTTPGSMEIHTERKCI
jgi:hypothetical protein